MSGMPSHVSSLLRWPCLTTEAPQDLPPHVTTKHTPSKTPPPPRVAHQKTTTGRSTSRPKYSVVLLIWYIEGEVGGGGAEVIVDITEDTRKLDLSHGNFTSLPSR